MITWCRCRIRGASYNCIIIECSIRIILCCNDLFNSHSIYLHAASSKISKKCIHAYRLVLLHYWSPGSLVSLLYLQGGNFWHTECISVWLATYQCFTIFCQSEDTWSDCNLIDYWKTNILSNSVNQLIVG